MDFLEQQDLEKFVNFLLKSTFIGLSTACLLPLPGLAQLTPDNSLGAESSIVNPDASIDGLPTTLIEGGAARGSNLFHSFQEFNVKTGQQVYFANPVEIENILTRVTGDNLSNIDGLLGVNGAANLFLLNPNGVVFGPNATLDISGSFLTSTGTHFTFADGSEFSAMPIDNELLSLSVPLGVQFNDRPQGDISQNGDLSVAAGKTLTLFGNTVINSGRLASPGGTVQVLGDRVGLIEQAQVDVAGDLGGGSVLIGGGYQGNEDVPNAIRTYVGPEVLIRADALVEGDGGRVIVWADDQTGFWGQVSAQGGPQAGNGGFVEISGKAALTFDGAVNTEALNGQMGTLLLDPTNIIIANFVPFGYTNVGSFNPVFSDFLYAASEHGISNSHIFPSTVLNLLSQNDLTLEATNRILILNDVVASSDNDLTLRAPTVEVNNFFVFPNLVAVSAGGGDLFVEAPLDSPGVVNLMGGAFGTLLASTSNGIARGGDVNVTGSTLNFTGGLVGAISILSPGANLSTGDINITGNNIYLNALPIPILGVSLPSMIGVGNFSSSGTSVEAGEINVTSNNSLEIDASVIGALSDSPSSLFAERVDVQGDNIALTNQARIGTGLSNGAIANSISIDIDGDELTLDGQSFVTTLVLAGSTTNGGDIDIAVDRLRIVNSSGITSPNLGAGNSGQIRITAEDVTLESEGRISSVIGTESVTSATGDSQGILINTGNLSVADGSIISASTFAEGNSGPVVINTAGDVRVTGTNASGRGSAIVSQVFSTATGDSSGIVLNSQNLLVSGGAVIGSDTVGQGNSGTIQMNVAGDISLEGTDSRIQSTVFEGAIGNSQGITINSNNLSIANGAQIIASTAGRGNAGRIQIDTDSDVTVNGTNSRITSQVEKTAIGQSGGIAINGDNLSVLNGANISASTFGQGNSGRLQIDLEETVLLRGNNSALVSQVNSGASGDSAGIIVNAANLSVIEGGTIDASVSGQGNSGAVQIDVDNNLLISGAKTGISSQVNPGAIGNSGGIQATARLLTVASEAVLGTSTFGQGNSGSIDLNIAELTTLRGGYIVSQVNPGAIGNSAGIGLKTGNLSLFENAFITADTAGEGNAGLVNIETAGDLLIDTSQIVSRVINRGEFDRGQGDSSGITIAARNLRVFNNAVIDSSTESQGDAGPIRIRTSGDILLDENSGISSRVVSTGEGNGSDITIQANNLSLAGNSAITSATFGRGNAGDIELDVSNQIVLIGEDTGLFASTEDSATGSAGGTIRLLSPTISADQGAWIAATTSGQSPAGNLELSTNTLQVNNGAALTSTTISSGDAGLISVQPYQNGPTLNIYVGDDSTISSSTLPGDDSQDGSEVTGNSGRIIFRAPTAITLSGVGDVKVETETAGNAGALEMIAPQITLDGIEVSASTEFPEWLSANQQATLIANRTSGQGGDIDIDTTLLTLLNRSEITAATSSAGDGGSFSIASPTDELTIRGNGSINVNTENVGSAGSLEIEEVSTVTIDGVTLSASTMGAGPGGNVELDPATIRFANGGQIAASTSGSGNGGNVIFNLPGNSLLIAGDGEISVATSGTGAAGAFADGRSFNNGDRLLAVPDITIDGALLTASTTGPQSGGDVNIRTSRLTFANSGAIAASTSGSGDGGSLTITGNSPLTLRGNGRLTVASSGATSGRAGDLNVSASTLSLRDGVELSVNSASSAGGGNINLTVDGNMFVTGNSFINATSTNPSAGDGGNVNISLSNGFLIGAPGQDNDLIANAVGGNGGNINISALRLFGFSLQDEPNVDVLRGNRTNDISASSEVGLPGSIALDTLDLDPSQGLTELPVDLQDRANQITPGCGLGSTDDGSEFIVTGRGGLPPNPNDPIAANGVHVPWVEGDEAAPSAPLVQPSSGDEESPLVEAQGIGFDREGNAYFVTEAATGLMAHAGAIAPKPCEISATP